MPYPGSYDAPDTTMQGGSLLATNDHALSHRTLGSALGTVERVIGTTNGTAIAMNFAAGDFGARINSSNVLQQPLTGTLGMSAGSITGQITNTGTVANGVYGTATYTGGTANNQVVGTPAITGGTFNSGVIGTPSITGGTVNNSVLGTVKARAYLLADQSIPNTTFTKVTLNTKDYDVGTNFDATTNYRFTAPVTGYYLVIFHISVAAGAAAKRVILSPYLNGVARSGYGFQASTSTGGDTGAAINDVMKLNANDYLEMWVYQDTGGTVSAHAGVDKYTTYAAFHLLSI